MSTEDYEIRLRAIDDGFTAGADKAVDRLGEINTESIKTIARIEKLERTFIAAGQTQKMSAQQYGAIAASLNRLDKEAPDAAKAIAAVRAELERLRALEGQRGTIMSQIKSEAAAEKAAKQEAARVASSAASEQKAAAAQVRRDQQAAQREAAAAAKAQRAAANQAVRDKKEELEIAKQIAAIEKQRNSNPGFRNDAAGINNEATTAAYTNRNLAANEQLKAAILERGRIAQQVEKDHGKALIENARYLDKQYDSLSNNRYVLYDVASTWGTVSAATLGAVAATVKFAAEYESIGSSIQRTSGATQEQFDGIYDSLIDLSTRIPESFADIGAIATLGGQLGIATDNIESFTETVVKFSATTNVTAEQAAESLGRVAQLTKTSGSQYENLASAIYEVGINSVATESAILSTATEIATAGDLAGFSQHQIVALAGAFASLNIKPERARGSVQRIFGEITEAVDGGGKALDQFAHVSRMSVNDFATTWKNSPQEAFNAFLTGIQRVQAAGGDTNSMLKDLGIAAVRDIQGIQALANNMDVYARAQEDANTAFAEGTALGEGYGVVADDLASLFTQLMNSVKAAAADLGDVPGVKETVKLLQMLVDSFRAFAANPIGKVVTTLGMAFTALVGVIAAGRAAIALAQASTIGLMQAQRMLTTGTSAQIIAGKGLAKTLLELGVGNGRVAAATEAYTQSLNRNTAAQAANNASGVVSSKLSTTKAAFAGANAAVGGFGSMLSKLGKGLGKGGLLIGGLTLFNDLGHVISESMKSSSQRVQEYGADLSAVAEAIKKDTEVYEQTGASIRTVTTNVSENVSELPVWQTELMKATSSNEDLAGAIDGAKDSTKEFTYAIGENTKVALAQAIASSDKFMKDWQQYAAQLEETGFNLEDYFNEVVKSEDGKGGTQYIDNLKNALEELRLQEISNLRHTNDNGVALENIDIKYTSLASALEVFNGHAKTHGGILHEVTSESYLVNAALEAMGVELDEVDEAIEEQLPTWKDFVKAATDAVGATANVAGAVQTVAERMAENGDAGFTFNTEEGVRNIEALRSAVDTMADASGDSAAAFSGNLAGLISGMQNAGIALTGEATFVGDIFSQVFGEEYGVYVNPTDALTNIAAVIDAAIIAQQQLYAMSFTSVSPFGGVAVPSAEGLDALKRLNELKGLKDALADVDLSLGKNTGKTDQNTGAKKRNSKATKEQVKELVTLTDYANEVASVFNEAIRLRFQVQDAKDDMKEAWREVNEAFTEKPIELEFDFSDSLDDAFDLDSAKDAVTRQFLDMKKAAEDAAKAVRDAQQAVMEANAEVGTLENERTKLMRQIAVSEMYGETQRAADARARLAELDAQISEAKNNLADANQDLKDAQAAASRVTTGDSAEALNNRAELRDLSGAHFDYIDALIASGASNKKIKSAIDGARKAFTEQAKALGFSEEQIAAYLATMSGVEAAYQDATNSGEDQQGTLEGNSEAAIENRRRMQNLVDTIGKTAQAMLDSGVPADKVAAWLEDQKKKLADDAKEWGISETAIGDYTGAIEDMQTIVNSVPNNVTKKLKFDADIAPAERAINTFLAKERHAKKIKADADTSSASNAMNKVIKSFDGKKIKFQAVLDYFSNLTNKKATQKSLHEALAAQAKAYKEQPNGGTRVDYWDKKVGQLKRELGQYFSGGYTGKGNKFEVAGLVHRGEYVVPKHGVDQSTGLPKPDYLQSLFVPNQTLPSVVSPAASNSAVQVVELLPTQLAELASAVSTTLVLDGRAVAKSVNQANKNSSFRGNA